MAQHNLDLAKESSVQEIKNLISTEIKAQLETLGGSFANCATKQDVEKYVFADKDTTDLLITLIDTRTQHGNTVTYHCPYSGRIKIEAQLYITDDRSNSADGSLDVSCVLPDGTSYSSDNVCRVSDGNERTATGSVLINIISGSKLVFKFSDAKYETVYTDSLKIYGKPTDVGFVLLDTVANHAE